MTWWPWVSSRAYDEVRGQRDRLEKRVDRLEEALVAMSRFERGMPELDPEKRAKVKAKSKVQIPPRIQERIDGYENRTIRQNTERKVLEAYRRGLEWSQIEKELERITGGGDGDRSS